jgi:hypothetical protein
MNNPVLAAVIGDLPRLLGDPDFLRRVVDHYHGRIELYTAHIDETANRLENLQQMDRLLRATHMTTDEEIERFIRIAANNLEVFQRQRRKLTQVLAFLLLVRAAAYARTRSRLVPGVLLAAASAAAFPGFRTLVRLSLLTLGFLFASHQLPAGEG